MTDSSKRTDIVVFRTGRLLEADMVANHFDEEGIPYYRRMESSSGIELATPLMPVQGPGDWWVIRVQQEHTQPARDVINSLPVEADMNPGVWAYGPSKGSKRYWKMYAYVVIFGTILALALWIIRLISE